MNPNIDLMPFRRVWQWTQECALPYWGAACFDIGTGSFVEAAGWDGEPLLEMPRRTMVQARQIYVFAHASLLGWSASGRDLALEAAGNLIDRHFTFGDGDGWVFSITRDGKISDPKRDLYAYAFALYGLAWAYMLEPNPRFIDVARRTLFALDADFATPSGGFFPALGSDSRQLLQNPHMHLFEALIAWYSATGDKFFLVRAGKIFRLMTEKFFQADTCMLAEFFDDSWKPVLGPKGRLCEPGHHYEWAWLLHKYLGLLGRKDHHVASLLKDFADRFGVDSAGFTVDVLRDDGSVQQPSRRCWPQTERIKAEVAAFELGDADAPVRAVQVASILLEHFLGRPAPGGWVDHLDASGRPLVRLIPASSFYHIFLAAAEADRVWGGETNFD